ncbi:MAG: sulfatase [Deltaproteobacteria bacterium]|nr:sulfatase [Deltaproteobacteria bacterium]
MKGKNVRVVAKMFLFGVWFAAFVGCSADHRLADSDSDPFNVVLISIDTLAADHLGLYGYSRNTSPNLDRYAESAIVFENAYSTAPKTPESHMSMFTSLYPSVHGVFTIKDPDKLHVLDSEVRTLSEVLKQDGYTTAGFHGGGYVDGQFGFGRGFDEYHQGEQRRAEEWLWKNGKKGKFFLFFHTYRVHDPYTPTPPYDRRFDSDYSGPIVHDMESLMKMAESTEWIDYSTTFWSQVDKSDPDEVAHVVSLYDGVIAEMDENLVDLLSAIDRHAPRTIVIILSDHGEEFGQHGMFTHSQLYDEILHVPLIIRHPDRTGGERIAERVSLIDLAPTILEMLSIPAEAQFQGRALFDRIDRAGNARPVFSEFPIGERMALIRRDRKLMLTSGHEEFYDLRRDPEERRDLRLSEIERAPDDSAIELDALRKEMARVSRDNAFVRDSLGLREATEAPTDEVLQQLKALGYLE